jgi:hypothetical protein
VSPASSCAYEHALRGHCAQVVEVCGTARNRPAFGQLADLWVSDVSENVSPIASQALHPGVMSVKYIHEEDGRANQFSM